MKIMNYILSVVGSVASLVNYLLFISYYTYIICKPIIDMCIKYYQ